MSTFETSQSGATVTLGSDVQDRFSCTVQGFRDFKDIVEWYAAQTKLTAPSEPGPEQDEVYSEFKNTLVALARTCNTHFKAGIGIFESGQPVALTANSSEGTTAAARFRRENRTAETGEVRLSSTGNTGPNLAFSLNVPAHLTRHLKEYAADISTSASLAQILGPQLGMPVPLAEDQYEDLRNKTARLLKVHNSAGMGVHLDLYDNGSVVDLSQHDLPAQAGIQVYRSLYPLLLATGMAVQDLSSDTPQASTPQGEHSHPSTTGDDEGFFRAASRGFRQL